MDAAASVNGLIRVRRDFRFTNFQVQFTKLNPHRVTLFLEKKRVTREKSVFKDRRGFEAVRDLDKDSSSFPTVKTNLLNKVSFKTDTRP